MEELRAKADPSVKPNALRRVSDGFREVMDIRQAAEYLGIAADTLYQYAAEGLLPAFKLGNRWRFKRSRLDEWMDRASDYQGRQRFEVFKRGEAVRG